MSSTLISLLGEQPSPTLILASLLRVCRICPALQGKAGERSAANRSATGRGGHNRLTYRCQDEGVNSA